MEGDHSKSWISSTLRCCFKFSHIHYYSIYFLLQGQICGLCGNYDGNGINDFTTRSQSVVENVLEFGNSWKVSSTCPDAYSVKDPCSTNPYRKSWSEKQCSIINSNVFAACHSQVLPGQKFTVWRLGLCIIKADILIHFNMHAQFISMFHFELCQENFNLNPAQWDRFIVPTCKKKKDM